MSEIRTAFRLMLSQPGFTLVVVAMMALGIGANTTVFSLMNGLLLRPLPFPEPERLVRIHAVRGTELGKLMVREWEELDRDHELFDGVAGWYPSQYSVLNAGKPEVWRACMTTANLFRVLGVRLPEGSSWEEGTHRSRNPSVVLNYELWQNKLGGERALLGKSITMDDAPYQVTGVAEPGFQFPTRSDIFRAAFLGGAQSGETRSLYVVGRLRRGITLVEAQTRLNAFANRLAATYPQTNREIKFQLNSLRDDYVGEVRPYLYLTSILAAVVLLIACGNVINLLLARGLVRNKEIAIRSALGAGRWQVVRQLLTETALLTTSGGALGVLFAFVSVRITRDLLRLELPQSMRIEIDLKVLLFALAVSAVAAMIAGLLPAIAGSRFDVQAAMRETSRGASASRAQGVLRNVLVTAELALTVVLLTSGALLAQSFVHMQNADLGFRRASMLTFHTDPPLGRYSKVEQTAQFYRQALERLSAIPGVEAAAANHSPPLALNQNYAKPVVVIEGQSVDEQLRNPFVNPQIISPNYLSTMGIPLIQGRAFDESDRIGGQPVAILSRPLAERLFGQQNPIGKRMRFSGLLGSLLDSQNSWFTVIGIAGGVRSETLFGAPSLDVYLSNQQQFAGDTFFLLKTRQDPLSLSSAAATAVLQVDSQQPIFDIRSLNGLIEDTVWQRRMAARFSLAFGLLALILATAGTFGVLSYSISQRRRELAIRQAIGATQQEIWRLVMSHGLSLGLVGVAVGGAIAIIVARSISSLLYEVSALDVGTYGVVIGVVCAMVLGASAIPAWRAGRIDPTVALREG